MKEESERWGDGSKAATRERGEEGTEQGGIESEGRGQQENEERATDGKEELKTEGERKQGGREKTMIAREEDRAKMIAKEGWGEGEREDSDGWKGRVDSEEEKEGRREGGKKTEGGEEREGERKEWEGRERGS